MPLENEAEPTSQEIRKDNDKTAASEPIDEDMVDFEDTKDDLLAEIVSKNRLIYYDLQH